MNARDEYVKAQAEQSWEVYKQAMRHHPRRQLRKRDFIAGFLAGTHQETDRTREVVIPHTLRLYDLARALEANPDLGTLIRTTYPETTKALIEALEDLK